MRLRPGWQAENARWVTTINTDAGPARKSPGLFAIRRYSERGVCVTRLSCRLAVDHQRKKNRRCADGGPVLRGNLNMTSTAKPRWPWFKCYPQELRNMLDVLEDQKATGPEILTTLRVQLLLVEDDAPPVLFADRAWMRMTGCRSKETWWRRRGKMVAAGIITTTRDGAISSPFTDRVWAERHERSEQNRANAQQRGIASQGRRLGVDRSSIWSEVRKNNPTVRKIQEKQSEPLAVAMQSLTDKYSQEKESQKRTPRHRQHVSENKVFDETEARRQCETARPSQALRRTLKGNRT